MSLVVKNKYFMGVGLALQADLKRRQDEKRARGIACRTNQATGERYYTNEHEDDSWVKMRSITEQGNMDDFLSTAQVAGADFTAQKMNNIKIIHTDQKNPYLLTPAEELEHLKFHKENRERLTVPRRPKWDETTTPFGLSTLERESYMKWRRGLARLEDNKDVVITPFERNLEVWRQLWRVIERSDLVVQIVDARNPLLFRCKDLENYVKEVDPKKQNLMLINKADMMSDEQRTAWAAYLKSAKIPYKFFSAKLAKERNELRDLDEAKQSVSLKANSPQSESEGEATASEEPSEPENNDDLDTRILTVEELEYMFLKHTPKNNDGTDAKMVIGLVGYPNVGKSSTINAIMGAKKVSVSSTPGKTKHFQTLNLSDKVVLCDCPGLVFPNFATTKADLVCNGVLPIDEQRDYTGPAGLVVQRIPKDFLEALYGIQIRTRPVEDGGTGIPTGPELLRAYGRARGYMKTGQGEPDESRAARYILKDYVNGKMVYCVPPPDGVDGTEFNKGLYGMENLPEKRQKALTALMEKVKIRDGAQHGVDGMSGADMIPLSVGRPAGPSHVSKLESLNREFFKAQADTQARTNMPFSHKYTQQGQAARASQVMGGKKHFKGGSKSKGKKKAITDDDYY